MIRKISLFCLLVIQIFFSPFGLQNHTGQRCFFFSHDTAYAQTEEQHALTVWPHEKSDLDPDPAILYGRLPNGLRYVLMKNQEPKDRVSMHLNIQVGSMHEEEAERGIAHFLEHMLFNGSTHFPPGELVKFFQSIGMQFGNDVNAHTSFYETVYDVLLPDSKKESLEKGLLVFQDYAEGALLLHSEVEKERKVILAEKRTRDSADYRTYEASLEFEFPDARISKRLPIGTEKTILATTRESLKKFYDVWYRPENMTIVMAGDFQTELAETLIHEKFSAFKPRIEQSHIPPFGKISHLGIKPFYHYEKETGNTDISIGYVKKILEEPDSFELQKRLLIDYLGFQIVQNRLDTMVRKPDTPFTEASASSGIAFRKIQYADISAQCSPEKWEESLTLLEKTLRTAVQYKFTESELSRVKKEYLSSLDKAVKGAKTRDSQKLSYLLVHHINNDRVFQSPEQEKKLFSPVIQSLTTSQVHKAFQKIWAPDSRLISVTGNAEIAAKAEDKIQHAFQTSLLTEVPKPIEEEKIVFPYLKDPVEKGKIIHQNKFNDLGIICTDFQNNVRLNLKKTDFKANEVLIALSFGKGRCSEPAKIPGASILGEAVVNGSGLNRLQKDDLEKALAGKNTHIQLNIEENRFVLMGNSVSDEIRLLFQLLYAYAMDMGFDKDSYKLSMERFVQTYTTLEHTPEGGMELSGKRFLAGGDHRFGLPELETLKQISLSDIQSWILDALQSSPLEISVVGDFDPQEVIELTAQYFGSLPSRKELSNDGVPSSLPVFPIAQTHKIKVPTKINKGIVTVAYPTTDFWNISNTRRLSVLGEIYSERMRIIIREKLGASYSTYAYNHSSRAYKGYGLFQAVAQINPDEKIRVESEIKKIATDIAAKGITDDELRRALDPIITSIKDFKRSNRYWLNSVLVDLKNHPQQLEWSRTMLSDYQSITREEMKALGNTYLQNQNAAVIQIEPQQAQKE
ncbi:MAG: insulinase family protein [Deltaproteobacteria bacterium]|nr:MAG: insulinase family protein [Deltaproteobacteria bacterium]